MTLCGQTAVVTGASRGIGRAIATALATQGMTVVLVARTVGDLEALASELPGSIARPTDVTDPTAVARLASDLGPVDLLVNNAGRIEPLEVPFWEADPVEVWGVVETNLRGPLLMTRAVLPGMVARGSGRVVNVASRARAATETGTYTGYAVSKRALSVLTESLARPLADTGVVVVDVLPGLVRTGLTLSMPVWADRPDQVWDQVSFTSDLLVQVARGEHDARHGQVLDAPGLLG